MFAVLKTGGKQYLIEKNSKIIIEKIEGEENAEIEFDNILGLFDGDIANVKNNCNNLDSLVVKAKILRQFKDDKVIVFKKKKRKNYRRKNGHRQNLTEIQITDIK